MRLALKVVILLFSFIFVFVACASNKVKNSNESKNFSNSNNNQEKVSVEKVFLFDSTGIKEVKRIPSDIERIKSGALIFNSTNVIIIVVSSYYSMDEVTNEVLSKNDVSRFVFDNFVRFKNEKDSNEEYLEGVNFYRYVFKEDFNFDKSYVLKILENGKEKFKVLSIYKCSDESFQENIMSIWEGICWDKEVNLNITEKFMRLILSNYDMIKKKVQWIN
ncbi:MAG: hypothetical protein ACK4F9_04995 [Brevinematia bacterium]